MSPMSVRRVSCSRAAQTETSTCADRTVETPEP
jgi:hypothetical protein